MRPRDGTYGDGSGPPLSPGGLHSRFSEFKVADVRSKKDTPAGLAVSVQMQTYSKADDVYDGSGESSVRI
jgi:hypothetical protein